MQTIEVTIWNEYHTSPDGLFHIGKTLDDQTIIAKDTDIFPIGVPVKLVGEWKDNARYGMQFQVEHIIFEDDKDALYCLFSSGFVKGIRSGKARDFVDWLGDQALEILNGSVNEPLTPIEFWKTGTSMIPRDILLGVNGVGQIVVEQIIEDWEHRGKWVKLALTGMKAHLSLSQIRKVRQKWPKDGHLVILNEPYRLTVIKGITFEKADVIAQMSWPGKIPVPHDSPMRYAAGIRHVLNEQLNMGHVCYPLNSVIDKACELLNPGDDLWKKVEPNLVREELVVYDSGQNKYLFTKEEYDREGRIARDLVALVSADRYAKDVHYDRLFDRQIRERVPFPTWAEIEPKLTKYCPFELSEDQVEALRVIVENPIVVLTGGPGTGKTTIIKIWLNILEDYRLGFVQAAPTGIAALRMEEATGCPSSTIHRLLHLGGPEFEELKEIMSDATIVDEFSMCDNWLTSKVVAAILLGNRLLFVGDSDQLPPVGPGEALYQVTKSGIVPVVRLTVIHRQGENSGIVHACKMINEGKVPPSDEYADFRLGTVGNNASLSVQLIKLLPKIMDKYKVPLDEIMILTPNNGHEWGQKALNLRLQAIYNPGDQILPGVIFRPDDPVMQLVNNYKKTSDIYNGEVGIVTTVITPEEEKELGRAIRNRAVGISRWDDNRDDDEEIKKIYVVYVRYGDDKVIGYTRDELIQIRLAYASTIHKSQGMEYRFVIYLLPLGWSGFMLRQLPYTATSRAKEYCLVLQTQNAMAQYTKDERRIRRWTCLAGRLQREKQNAVPIPTVSPRKERDEQAVDGPPWPDPVCTVSATGSHSTLPSHPGREQV